MDFLVTKDDDANFIRDHEKQKIEIEERLLHSKHEIEKEDTEPATFEDAIKATGFGKFNVILTLAMIFPSMAEIFEVVSLSYVLPIAHCDLNLTLNDKGMLNAMSFAGMVTSALFWGRVCDTLGRKNVIVYGYICNGFLAVIVSLTTNITALSIAKFLGGLIINGPYSASVSHLSEFHSSKYRARVQIVRGIMLSSSNIILPLMAWGILPRKIDFSPFGIIDYHSWNIYLMICALPPIISGIIYFFMPESPKFLMTIGKNKHALEIFRKVYKINTGKPDHTFPIKRLVRETYCDEEKNIDRTSVNVIREGLNQMKPFLNSPHISRIIIICTNAFLLTMSMNLVKLWLPQIFQASSDYELNHGSNESSDVCSILRELRTTNVTKVEDCKVNLDNTSVYVNSMIVGIVRVGMFSLAGTLVNLLGKKTLTLILSFASGSFCSAVYFSPNPLAVLILYALHLSLGCVSDNLLTTTTLELFPTTLRTSALCLHLMFGRIGTVVGNVILPQLLLIGCAPPIFFLGSIVFVSAILTTLYPSTENKPLI
ncbi:unnamed protein product [Phaedon cochleariae]|uniref:Major facilitator superfamily (MFS) profile domain-containing protein n=1 Tax=Phaedon cochleariae TaxID=80249 RepID=A0A9P0DTJ1_PHACE|nr:unnamed protein product [Phaedon cochleariae]